MISIIRQNNQLLLVYKPSMGPVTWVDRNLRTNGKVWINGVFAFGTTELVDPLSPEDDGEDEFGTRTFILGVLDGDFYRIKKEILDIKYNLRLHNSLTITGKTFIAERKISIFKKIDKLVDEEITIGGDIPHNIPIREFENLLKTFPSSTELTHYAGARISYILKDYLGTISDEQQKLERYLHRRQTISVTSGVGPLYQYELEKYTYIRDEISRMLENSEPYSEHDWQEKIIKFVLLLFPKYIAVLENVKISDFYSTLGATKNRFIDLTLVDANGSIDIIEIKKPFPNCILSANKYRDNYTPKLELSGAVMQVEKYLFHLNKWGQAGEQAIHAARGTELPAGLQIRVTNPKAIIILGRDSDFDNEQRLDFEIIRRKYANIIDIMTYDDLLLRLKHMIAQLQRRIG